MRLPRVRLKLRDVMALVVIVSLILGWAAYQKRLRRQIDGVMNQDIRVSAAEANYQNAGLAREAAEAAIVRYTAERSRKDDDPTLGALKAAARNARQRELFKEAVWKEEKERLSRLIRDLRDSWH